MSALPGPLRLEPIFLPKVWAAPNFPEPFQSLWDVPAGIGEVWLASDRHHVTPIAAGPHQGMGLDEAVARWPEHILGPGQSTGFPLLIKLLNVGQWLSVQVHPDDEQARALENEPWGKNEAWHLLAAQPGAEMILGLVPGVDRQGVKQAIKEKGLVDVLAKVPVSAGQTYALPAGTVHAAGPGMFFFEVQQASDVTYRLYDWDRPDEKGNPRPLHIGKALEVMKITGPGSPQPPRELSPPPLRRSRLLDDPHFSLLECALTGQQALTLQAGRPTLLLVLEGSGVLSFPGQEHQSRELAAGQTWLLPAATPSSVLSASKDGIMYLEAVAART